jgi:photosystem II stability/assembly factor-like uncharacterized protein
VFKSTDGGTTWSAVNSGLTNTAVFALAIDPTTPNTLYAGTGGGGVFKSTNGGATWVATGTGPTNVRALAINPTTPTTLYAGTNGGGVFKSTDGGTTWSAVNTGLTNLYVRALVINPTARPHFMPGRTAQRRVQEHGWRHDLERGPAPA